MKEKAVSKAKANPPEKEILDVQDETSAEKIDPLSLLLEVERAIRAEERRDASSRRGRWHQNLARINQDEKE